MFCLSSFIYICGKQRFSISITAFAYCLPKKNTLRSPPIISFWSGQVGPESKVFKRELAPDLTASKWEPALDFEEVGCLFI